MPLTRSEALVEQLCKRSLLSLWSYANPRSDTGKELCDVLVVCEPDIVIFSVKEIGLRDPDNETDVARWRRKAIEQSAHQIHGAERKLAVLNRVIRSDSTPGLALPSLAARRIH